MSKMVFGEKLPLPLFEVWMEYCFDQNNSTTYETDRAVKKGIELCAGMLLPLLSQCVPCVDKVARDRRITKDDANLLTLLAQIRQLTS